MSEEEQLRDAAAREAIRTRLEQNFLVEAGAGSGKTTCLVDRMAALLAAGICRPEKMAAVTFTRKAAGELKEKFQLRLEEMFAREDDPYVKSCLEEALGKMERVFVGTIHSFCARLLRERPVEAGIAPDFTEVEGLEERLLEEAAWEDYLLELRFTRPEQLQKLDELDLSPEDIKDAFQQLNRYPDVEMAFSEAPYPELSEARENLEHFCTLARELLPTSIPSKGWDGLQTVSRTALRWQRVFDLQQDRYLLRLLEKMDKNASPTYNRWPVREQAEELAAAFQELRESKIKPAREAWLKYRHQHLLHFLLPAAKRYQKLRRRENKLNYQDLLMLAAELLKNNPEVRGYFQNNITHLLVDEFQDTDPIQAEVMFYLTGSDLTEKEWTKLVPRPGSLFVVGDPKQSIYRFRRADIDTYYRVKEMITLSGGEILHLTTNFRSLPQLIEWTNNGFEELFSPAPPPYQAEFVPMEMVRRKDPDAAYGVYRLELEDVKGNNAEQIAWQDACRIADWINHSLNGGIMLSRTAEDNARALSQRPVPGDFLLLVHYKKHMSLYARALEARGIPFNLSGGGDISESEELKELLCLLRALADPDNPVPLVASLRGLFFGISDDHLYRFKNSGGRFYFLRDLPATLDREVQEVFAPAWDTLRRYWRWSRELLPSSALHKIVSELGLLPLALAEELGKGRAGYILQVLELLRQRERQGVASFSEAVDFLSRLLAEGLEEELDIEGGGTSAVRIMNLHKAKGLEAPVVILANPGRSPSHEPVLHIMREAEKARGYLVIQKGGTFGRQTLAIPPDWDHYGAEESKYQEAEAMRLLYVAATRAKDLLVISTYPKKPENSPWHLLEQFLRDKEVLSEPEAAAAAADAEKKEPFTLPMLQEAREEINNAAELIAAPTYARQRAAEARGEEKPTSRGMQGHGATWGKIIHAALEEMVKSLTVKNQAAESIFSDEELQALAKRSLRKEDEAPERAGEVVQALKGIILSTFWQRICASDERHAEVPFGIRENDNYTTGIIDLAFREAEGWVLADYKTDAVKDESHLQKLADYYAPQLEAYCRCWEQITGEKVVEYGFFFTDKVCYVEII